MPFAGFGRRSSGWFLHVPFSWMHHHASSLFIAPVDIPHKIKLSKIDVQVWIFLGKKLK
jgi:hypothetical protein